VNRDDDVQSPCNKICVVDPSSQRCIGCLRTLDEIARWGEMTNEERREVLAAIASRGEESR
jgi:predicted Fe-S protein YdhL (DUF1289 family)